MDLSTLNSFRSFDHCIRSCTHTRVTRKHSLAPVSLGAQVVSRTVILPSGPSEKDRANLGQFQKVPNTTSCLVVFL